VGAGVFSAGTPQTVKKPSAGVFAEGENKF
jgi:hypothetical protein